jgi:hypothetical protein
MLGCVANMFCNVTSGERKRERREERGERREERGERGTKMMPAIFAAKKMKSIPNNVLSTSSRPPYRVGSSHDILTQKLTFHPSLFHFESNKKCLQKVALKT